MTFGGYRYSARFSAAFFGMQEELGQLLNREVDMHTPGSLSKYFRDRVMAEAQVQYDAA
jgi:uncharacterized protein